MELKPFQVDGVRFLTERSRALLADQMGLGKTAQVIRALDTVGDTAPLIVCPAIACEHWRRQFHLWAGRTHWPTIVSYDQLRIQRTHLRKQRWDALVLDECHYTKSMSAKRTQAVWGKHGVARNSARIWSLSGTPAPNHYGELYPVLKACGRWKGTYYDFLMRFCEMDSMGKVVGNRSMYVHELRGILEGFMLRRLKKDVAKELPPISIHPMFVEPDPSMIAAVRPLGADRLAAAAAAEEKKLKAALMKLRVGDRMAYLAENMSSYSTWRRINGVMKVQPVIDTVLFELENRLTDKLVIYAYHRDVITLLRGLLKANDVKVATIWGGTPAKERTRLLDRFKRWPQGVFLGQILAAGTAIDLTCAHQGIMVEKDWVPGNNAQAMERMHRFGQTHPVTIRDVIISGGVDEIVSKVLDRKAKELSKLFD